MKLQIQMLIDGRHYCGEKRLKRSHTLEHTAITWHTGLDWIGFNYVHCIFRYCENGDCSVRVLKIEF